MTAFRFTNKNDASRYGRYRIIPDAGVEHLDDTSAKSKDGNYLFEELSQRVAAGPISFQILVQVASDGDVVEDATIHWPEDRPLVNFGKIVLSTTVPNDLPEQKKIIFDPIPRVGGIEASADPLFEPRVNVYLMSGRRRRSASRSPSAAD